PRPDPRQKVAGRAGIAVERLVPGGQVRPQPLPRLLPPAGPLRFPYARDVLAAGAADQGGGAGGAEAATGLVILGQGRVRGKSVGVEAGQGGRAGRERADTEQAEPLVVVARLVLPVQEGRQVRQY